MLQPYVLPRRTFLSVAAALLLLLSACASQGEKPKDSDPDPDPEVTAVVVALVESDLLVGDTTTAVASVTATGGASTDVAWSSENEAVATVDPAGEVTGVGAGATKIVATSIFDASFSGSAQVDVRVHVPLNQLTIDFDSAPLYLRGTRTATADVIIDDEPSTAVTWASDDAAVLTVDADTGVVFAAGVGTATLSAASTVNPGVGAELQVTVVHPFDGATVLYYHEDPITFEDAGDMLESAVVSLGLTLVSINGQAPSTDFVDAIADGPDLVFYELQNPDRMYANHLRALMDWVDAGGSLVFGLAQGPNHGNDLIDGRQDLVEAMGAKVVPAPERPNYIRLVEPELGTGIAPSLNLHSAFSHAGNSYFRTLEPLGQSVVWAAINYYNEAVNPAIVVAGNGGRTVVLGFPQTAIMNGHTFYRNLFVKVLRTGLEAR